MAFTCLKMASNYFNFNIIINLYYFFRTLWAPQHLHHLNMQYFIMVLCFMNRVRTYDCNLQSFWCLSFSMTRRRYVRIIFTAFASWELVVYESESSGMMKNEFIHTSHISLQYKRTIIISDMRKRTWNWERF